MTPLPSLARPFTHALPKGQFFNTNAVGCDGRKDVRPCISNRES